MNMKMAMAAMGDDGDDVDNDDDDENGLFLHEFAYRDDSAVDSRVRLIDDSGGWYSRVRAFPNELLRAEFPTFTFRSQLSNRIG